MATTTTCYDVGDDAWVEIGSGQPNVSVVNEHLRVAFIHVGQQAPAVDTPHRLTLPSGVENSINLGGLAGTDKVFALSADGDMNLIVLAGGA